VDSAAELAGLKVQLHAADAAVLEEAGTSCCDAKSDKYWVTDPSGIDWRTFHTPGCILT
jgi:lactoylglutathione lyase